MTSLLALTDHRNRKGITRLLAELINALSVYKRLVIHQDHTIKNVTHAQVPYDYVLITEISDGS